jgi:hypothetical protein
VPAEPDSPNVEAGLQRRKQKDGAKPDARLPEKPSVLRRILRAEVVQDDLRLRLGHGVVVEFP